MEVVPQEEAVPQEQVVSREEVAPHEEVVPRTAPPSTAIGYLRTRWGREAEGSRGDQHYEDSSQHDSLLFHRCFAPRKQTCAGTFCFQKLKSLRMNSVSGCAFEETLSAERMFRLPICLKRQLCGLGRNRFVLEGSLTIRQLKHPGEQPRFVRPCRPSRFSASNDPALPRAHFACAGAFSRAQARKTMRRVLPSHDALVQMTPLTQQLLE
jgi:hypothetical protein